MITKELNEAYTKKTIEYLEKAGIALTEKEKGEVEVADFGLNRVDEIGLELVVYVNTDRYCAKELVLLPGQICPEHRHPRIDNSNPGKQETFRCRWGEVYLYIPGDKTKHPKGKVPEDKKDTFTVWNEIVLRPGEQYTISSDTLHWFQSGEDGAIVSEFSSASFDEKDVFTDPEIQRITQIG